MKKHFLAFGLTLAVLSVPTFAQTYQLDDDLTPVDIEISQQTQDEIQRGLQSLANVNRGTNNDTPDTISVPDYKPVYYAMRLRIVKSLTKFTLDIQSLHDKVKKDLNKVSALESMKDSSPQFQQIYNVEAKKAYEKIGRYLNVDYQNAIKDLYTLNGMLDLAVIQNKKDFKDLFKEKHAGVTNLKRMCSTSICLGKVTKDITEWVKVVDSMNVNVDVISPKEVISFSGKNSNVSSINHFSTAINDFTRSLVKVGLKPNTVYSTGEAAATYLGQIGKSTLGVAFALATFPAKVINSAFRGIAKLDLSKDILIKDLSLKKVDTYDVNKAVKDMVAVSMKINTETSVAAGDDEIRMYLKKSLEKFPNEREYIIKSVLPVDKSFKEMIEKYYPEYLDELRCPFQIIQVIDRGVPSSEVIVDRTWVIASFIEDKEFRVSKTHYGLLFEEIVRGSSSAISYGSKLGGTYINYPSQENFLKVNPEAGSCTEIFALF